MDENFKAYMIQIFPLFLIFAVMLYLPWSSQRRDKKKKEEMLSTLKKDAKVRTIGGIAGTVVEVKDEDVVVRVDERNDTRMIFAKTSIASVAS